MLVVLKFIGKNGKVRYKLPLWRDFGIYSDMTFRTFDKAIKTAIKINPDIMSGGAIAVWSEF